MNPDGLWWLLILMGPFLVMQRSLHHEIQAVFLLITRRAEISQVLFAVLFFPGVLLHELSHFLAARILQVRTGRFSLVPRALGKGQLQLGYVETVKSDLLRDSLIGAAPLITGGLFVAYSGASLLHLPEVWVTLQAGEPAALAAVLNSMFQRPDFWLWIYLTVVVSSTMMPSPSDRRAWLPFGLIMALLLGFSLFAGAGPWMAQYLAPPLNQALRATAMVFGISLLVHMGFWPFFWAMHRVLSRMTGLEVG